MDHLKWCRFYCLQANYCVSRKSALGLPHIIPELICLFNLLQMWISNILHLNKFYLDWKVDYFSFFCSPRRRGVWCLCRDFTVRLQNLWNLVNIPKVYFSVFALIFMSWLFKKYFSVWVCLLCWSQCFLDSINPNPSAPQNKQLHVVEPVRCSINQCSLAFNLPVFWHTLLNSSTISHPRCPYFCHLSWWLLFVCAINYTCSTLYTPFLHRTWIHWIHKPWYLQALTAWAAFL